MVDVPRVYSFAIFDDGTGEKLYAGGAFSEIDGQPAENLAVFDGIRWRPIVPGTDDQVTTLRVLDDGSGPALFVGGRFQNAGGQPAMLLAKFDGTTWTSIPGLAINPDMPPIWSTIYDILYWDAGDGTELYVGGIFGLPGLRESVGVARLTESGFQPLGTGLVEQLTPGVLAVGSLRVIDLGGGPVLYVGGSFNVAGGVSARNIARWTGTAWSALGSGLTEYGGDGSYLIPTVLSILPALDGDNPSILTSGDFSVNGVVGVARWDGATWSAMPGSFLPQGARISILGQGGEAALYAYGRFTTIDGRESSGIARWDGSAWSNLGPPIFNHGVYALVDIVDSRGPAIFAGGGDFFGSPTWAPIARLGPITGDLNCDGAVSLADLALLLSAFGVSESGDLDGDGQTTIEDLTILLSKFGNTCGV